MAIKKYKFTLNKTRHSDQIGNCEICDQPGDMYIWARFKYYKTNLGNEGYSARPAKFGHKECLMKYQKHYEN